jgi:hypothetical protein
MGKSLLDRFNGKYIVIPNGCWIWTDALNDNGYGRISVKLKSISAHIISYNLFVGEVPKGLELDHTCKQTNCVNWRHLEPVTHAENMKRGFWSSRNKCFYGHEFSEENTYYYPNTNKRMCKTCNRIRGRLRDRRTIFYYDET